MNLRDDSLTASRYSGGRAPTRKAARVMIGSVKIKGYRAFSDFEMSDLARVNLLVGRNNTGKTSILEGLYLLASERSPMALWNILARRGETEMPEPLPGRPLQAEAGLVHIFHGHELTTGTELSITTTNEKPGRSVKYRIDVAEQKQNPAAFAQLADEGPGPRLALFMSGTPTFTMPPIPLSKLGALRPETLQQFANVRVPKPAVEAGSTQFVTTKSYSVNQIFQLWNSVVLTPDEDRVVAALRILEEKIERIAQVQYGLLQIPGQGYVNPSRGGFFVRLLENPNRLPIGSFGDGIWRMLALSVALARAKDSLLLIDEVDTGLHYTVMEAMWQLVSEAAELFNIQVFATTHSYDCVHSLAKICRDVDRAQSRITIQRIESGKKLSIPFSEREIRIAAEREIENSLGMLDKNNPRRCYVEDFDTSGAVVALMRLDNPELWPPGGKGAAVYVIPPDDLSGLLSPDSLHTELNGTGRKSLGIILDAETAPRAAWNRVKEFATSAQPPFEKIPKNMPPTGLILVNTEGKRLGLWIMPDNKSPGMLEDWLRELVPDEQNELWQFAVGCVAIARNEKKAKCRDAVVAKAHLHTLLAWQDPPGERIGTAIAKKLLDPEAQAAKDFVKWFKELFEL